MKLRSIVPALLTLATSAALAADYLPASQLPPAGISAEQAPMFVSIGFDDNGYSGLPASGVSGGMTWATDFFKNLDNPSNTGNPATFDGSDARVSFFFTSYYISTHVSEAPGYVKQSWRTAYDDGHGIANHTENHLDGENWSRAQWADQLQQCETWLTKPFDASNLNSSQVGLGAQRDEITGTRSPFLHYNDNLLAELNARGYLFDASIEDGWQPEQDGSNYFWPYTLDHGAPGHDYLYRAGIKDFVINEHPGLWETPVQPFVIPPDNLAAQYGLSYSLRDKIKSRISHFDVVSGKITALDYTLWVEAKMNKAEVLATLKYTLDLRLQGNRAPMLFGAHTDEYSDKYTHAPNATTRERQEAIEEFLLYALSKPTVRIRPYDDVIAWMKNPVPLAGDFVPTYTISTAVIPEIIHSGECSAAPWSASKQYTAGMKVSYNNQEFSANWWTQNNRPDQSPEWKFVADCASSVEVFHGTISPTQTTVKKGDNTSLTIQANSGYQIAQIWLNSDPIAISNPLILNNVQAAQQVTVSFSKDDDTIYQTITANSSQGGTISPNGAIQVAFQGEQAFSFTPDAGYELHSITLNGQTLPAVANYLVSNVTADQQITAHFAPIVVPQYEITASASQGGSISPSGSHLVNEGSQFSVEIQADAGYEISAVFVNGVNVGKVANYHFDDIQQNHQISATFTEQQIANFTVTASAGNGGSITPAGQLIAAQGSDLQYQIRADAGFVISNVLHNGVSLGAVTQVNISNLAADQQITASFEPVISGCSEPVWQQGNTYNGGQFVQHQNKRYKAKWWTNTGEPGKTGEWGVWQFMNNC